MRKMIALFISTAFLLGTTGFAVAQTSMPAPTQEKKTEEKTMEKKPAKAAMTMEEKKAACLQKATTDKAKADCEKKYMSVEEKKAACLQKAGTDEAKKAVCEKTYAAKPKPEKKEAMTEKKPK